MRLIEDYHGPSYVSSCVQSPPTVGKLLAATTLLTDFIAEKQQTPSPKKEVVQAAIKVSREAIKHYDGYDGKGQNIINDLRTFIDKASNSSRHMKALLERPDAYTTMKKIEQMFPPTMKPKNNRASPITIPSQKISKTATRYTSSSSSGDFAFMACTPPNTPYPSPNTSWNGSLSPKEFHLCYALMKPVLQWNLGVIE